MGKLLELLKRKRFLVSDGAWGTQLMKLGLESSQCPEIWNITNKNIVYSVAKNYVDAGADIIGTNSFGANIFKLSHFNLSEKIFEINKTAAEISREAAGNDVLVIGSTGPTGKFLITGEVTFDDLYETFTKQSAAFEEGGADAVCFETFYDIDEAKCAIKAAKENTALEIICSFTFDQTTDGNYKTMMGLSPETVLSELLDSGADIIGSNCGNGFQQIVRVAEKFRLKNARIPLIIQANAGLPQIINGQLIYSESPDRIENSVRDLLELNVNIIGGCCGTTPEHIRVIRKLVDEHLQII
ncbi:MAG: homocysteine S-methyltransferase family protein [Ignavibacteriaceae bacterium]|nr:homocysteine S-methyltransferase family protein [Ignavibacteriaceae bacterium]